jgi:hypothetical protein
MGFKEEKQVLNGTAMFLRIFGVFLVISVLILLTVNACHFQFKKATSLVIPTS